MEEPRLDREIKRLYNNLPYLWEVDGYHLAFFTQDFGVSGGGFIIGLENDVCKLIFEKKINSSWR
jgi:hypothetical protein